ncbi:hypothetical protein [Archaeoglobus sp.]
MKGVEVDPMNTAFAKTMEILTYVGLVLMIVPGLIYFVTGIGYVNTADAVANWGKSANEFWKATKGIEIHGYSWFLNNLSYFDCLSIVGVVILAITPLASIVAAMVKADTKYKIILLIAMIEFIVAIVRPLFMHVTGH